jgi:glycosyltransferase involved in cell wall biosynthesis
MRAIIITGEYPPDIGGISDYTFNLMNCDAAYGWVLFYKKIWNIFLLPKYIEELMNLKPDVIFLQFPTRGYGWSVAPHLICMYFSLFTKIRFVPVLHEYSELNFIMKIQINIILFSVKQLIVTNSFEHDAVIKMNKRLTDKVKIIKILSNTIPVNIKKPFKEREYDIAYFGLICKHKGIEFFINAVSDYRTRIPNIKTAIIGGFPDVRAYHIYHKYISSLARENGIDMIINKTLTDISTLLNNTKILLLPFPDGCSERRGSYIAGIKSGCVIITRKGKYTSREMLKTAYFIDDTHDIHNYFDEILFTITDSDYELYQDKINEYLSESIPDSWNEIVNTYNGACLE